MNVNEFKGLGRLYSDEEIEFFQQLFGQGGSSVPGHETPGNQPFIQVYVDPDNQEFFPKPPNEHSIGISGEPDRADTGHEIEI